MKLIKANKEESIEDFIHCKNQKPIIEVNRKIQHKIIGKLHNYQAISVVLTRNQKLINMEVNLINYCKKMLNLYKMNAKIDFH